MLRKIPRQHPGNQAKSDLSQTLNNILVLSIHVWRGELDHKEGCVFFQTLPNLCFPERLLMTESLASRVIIIITGWRRVPAAPHCTAQESEALLG